MKILFFLFCFCITFKTYSQTHNLEIESLAKRYSNGDFSLEDYQKYGKDWADLIKSMNGYPTLPYNNDKNEIEFKLTKSFNNIDKKTIYDRIMEWGAVSFGNLSSALNYSSLENGKIILKGWFEINYKIDVETFFFSKKESVSSVKCFFTYVFTIKDNKLKIEVLNISYKYHIPYYLVGSTFVPSYEIDRPIRLLYPITNSESIYWKGRLDLLNVTNITINRHIYDLENYINSKTDDYSF